MKRMRSALYLDFDNVFGGLIKLDPRLALRFAEEPEVWVERLAGDGPDRRARRWLVLRCYMNPAGWVPHPSEAGTRLFFSKFRPAFTDAGFEVIDCPRLSHTKNGADIRLVIDAVEALRADVVYEEFVVASGDSDMTPLIVRLRASDRQTTLLSPSDSAVVLGAVADRLIGGDELLELLDVPADDLPADLDDFTEDHPSDSDSPSGNDELSEADARARFGELVRARYADASEPIYLARLAQDLRRELGAVVGATRWFGFESFGRALQALDLPHVRMSQHHLWDSSRHTPPVAEATEAGEGEGIPDAVTRVARALKVPTLSSSAWQAIYVSLAAFTAAYEFNLTEITRWSRDRLAEADVRVSRQAIGIVVRGSAYGDCPLYRQPPPGPAEIGAAFVRNIVQRATAADVDLSVEELETVREWFGLPSVTEIGPSGAGQEG